ITDTPLEEKSPEEKLVTDIYKRYKKGQIKMDELKKITTDFIINLIKENQKTKKKVTQKLISKFILNKNLKSILKDEKGGEK
ncbi:MAG: hypothetical protein AAB546_00425, partial [Patescibacteria group bacterium]